MEPKRETQVKKRGISANNVKAAGSWICRVVSERSREAALGTRPILVGADETCDLVLDDNAVSRRHAEIRLVADGILIRDLGSTNGIYYRSSRAESVVILSDATIELGNTKLEITRRARLPVTPSRLSRFGGLVGSSVAMREVFSMLELAAPTQATVLIEGESGTGKEIAAQEIHDHSRRAGKPFVVVDFCAAPEHLLESQLFGHVRGAYTGAAAERRGAFVEANGGTLFLDELGELPLPCQGKLLRALEARTVQPLGSDHPVDVDVRVIAATNRDLEKMVEEKRFRFDLYQRLAVIHVEMPPLRDHLEDIPQLIQFFYEGMGNEAKAVGGKNLELLRRYDWPGNVRELRNVLERAWVLAGAEDAAFEDLSFQLSRANIETAAPFLDTSLSFKAAKEAWNAHFEREYIRTIYADHRRNISRAAAHAGINRNHFRKLLVKHGLLSN